MRRKGRRLGRWIILAAAVAVAGLAGGGWWYTHTPGYKARRLLAELAGDPPTPPRRWLMRLGLLKRRPRRPAGEIVRDLVALGEPAVPPLLGALADGDDDARRWAAWALLEIGPEDPRTVGALIAALTDADGSVRSCAAGALGKMGPAAAGAVGPLIQALNDDEPVMQIHAAQALGAIAPALPPGSPPAAAAAAALLARLREEPCGVWPWAAASLAAIDPPAAVTRAVPILLAHLGRELPWAPESRRVAADALGRLGAALRAGGAGAPGAVKRVEEALSRVAGEAEAPDLRDAAAEALRRIRSDGR